MSAHWFQTILISILLCCSLGKPFLSRDRRSRGLKSTEKTSTLPGVLIVVARYQENLSPLNWIKLYPHLVYNRGSDTVDFTSTAMRVNTGRESYIYLHHIIKHYNELSNVTIFLQADASNNPGGVHSPSVRANVEALASGKKFLPAASDGFAFLSVENNCESKLMSSLIKRQFELIDKLLHTHNAEQMLTTSYATVLNYTVPNPRFAPQGLFAVTRQAVHNNPVEYYESILQHLSHEVSPLFGHFMERAWPEVFHTKCSADPVQFYCLPGPLDSSC
eukprot:gene7546-9043_t